MTPADESALWEMFSNEARERTGRIVEELGRATEGEAAAEDLMAARAEAHTLKGAAGLMGQERLYELAERIERRLREMVEAGAVDAGVTAALIEATEAFLAGTEAAASGAELPSEVVRSIESLAG